METQKSFPKHLKKLNSDLLRKCTYKICQFVRADSSMLFYSGSITTAMFDFYENKKYLNVPRRILHVTIGKNPKKTQKLNEFQEN